MLTEHKNNIFKILRKTLNIFVIVKRRGDNKMKMINSDIKKLKLANHLTLFFPTFPFDPPENIRKPKVF